jgi:hypothetical protein
MDDKKYFFEEDEEESLEEIPDELPSFDDELLEDSEEIDVDVKSSRIEKDIVVNNSNIVNKQGDDLNLFNNSNNTGKCSDEHTKKEETTERQCISSLKENNTGECYSKVNKDKLFFSEALEIAKIAKLSDDEIIGNMEKKFELQSKHDELSSIENEIKGLLIPLSDMESKWRYLKKEIKEKQCLLKETEEKIVNTTLKVKELSSKKESLKKKLKC